MIVQETGNLPSQCVCLQQVARGSISIEELLLEGGGDGVPLRDEGHLEASKNGLSTMSSCEGMSCAGISLSKFSASQSLFCANMLKLCFDR